MNHRRFAFRQVVGLSKLTITIMCIALEIALVTVAFVLYLQVR